MRWILALALSATPAFAYTIEGGISNERGLIGVRTCERTIEKVYYGSPAWLANLKKGDRILEVDGAKKNDIIGEPYTEVHLLVKRPLTGSGYIMWHAYITRIPESEIKRRHFEYLRDH